LLVARVRRTLSEHALVRRGDRVLCAVSGGPDSIAMLHAMVALAPSLELQIVVATVDHGLRAESAAEAEAVLRYAATLGLEARPLALGLEPGTGVQKRAREARYGALRALAAELGAASIAVGHTLDDQAETVVLRLLRGAGMRGLAGVLPRRDDGVIRPLLDVTRAEVEAYLDDLGVVPPVRDPSNEDARYQRVRVRREILPTLSRESPAIARTIAALADEARELRAWIEGLGQALVAGEPRDRVDVARLSALAPPVRREVLRQWGERLVDAQLGRAHLEALEDALAGRGEAWLPGGFVVRIHGRSLQALPAAPVTKTVGNGGPTTPDPASAPPMAPPTSASPPPHPEPGGVGGRIEEA
jgi:tRNA(Ile)-lysidine synthase